MKKITYLVCVLGMALSLQSCDDFLDSFPEDKMTNENFWKTPADAEKLLVDLYAATMPKDGIFFDEAMSDNAYLCWEWWGGAQQVANGTYTTYGEVPTNKWKGCYTNIRKCWFLLEGLPNIDFNSEQDKNKILGETYFMLAYNYYLLTTYFGDVPLITKVLSISESKELVRAPRAEVTSYAIDRLKEAATMLEGLSQENGRITADACRCLMARLYLYNGDYQKVLETVKALEGKYQLYAVGETPYEDLFSGASENNCEIILSVPCDKKVGDIYTSHSGNGAMLLKGMSGGDPYTAIYPTGALIDAYPMADGRLIHETGSTYNPRSPYENRDPRFYQSVVYPTSQIKCLDAETNRIVERLYDPEDPTTIALQQYNASEPSRTGYMWNKYIDYSVYAMTDVWDCTNDIIVFRYADVILMKAEALVQVEGAGAKDAVCDLLDQLRIRCKGGKIHRENYNSKEALMDLVKNERRIELANEGIRFFDMIRWRDAEKNPVLTGLGLAGETYGAYMRLDGVGKDDRTVEIDGVPRRYIETRYFDASKGYLFPIPQGERDLNPGLEQNPNW